MSSGSYLQVYVGCPFYRSDDGRRHIVCEGITEDSSITQNFRTKSSFQTQMKVFCCEYYKNCELYNLLMDKYPEGEE